MSRFDDAYVPSPDQDADAVLDEVTKIHGGDLRGDLERVSSDVGVHGRRYARAVRNLLLCKARVVEVEEAAYLSIRNDADALGEKATEATIRARLGALSHVREARADLVEAEFAREVARSTCDALRAKREALTSLVQLAKAEMGGMGGSASWRDSSEDLPPREDSGG